LKTLERYLIPLSQSTVTITAAAVCSPASCTGRAGYAVKPRMMAGGQPPHGVPPPRGTDAITDARVRCPVAVHWEGRGCRAGGRGVGGEGRARLEGGGGVHPRGAADEEAVGLRHAVAGLEGVGVGDRDDGVDEVEVDDPRDVLLAHTLHQEPSSLTITSVD
jgi:hypothetical protein